MKKKRAKQRNVRYVDPGKTPLGSPRPLPMGVAHVAVMIRQLRRQAKRAQREALGIIE